MHSFGHEKARLNERRRMFRAADMVQMGPQPSLRGLLRSLGKLRAFTFSGRV